MTDHTESIWLRPEHATTRSRAAINAGAVAVTDLTGLFSVSRPTVYRTLRRDSAPADPVVTSRPSPDRLGFAVALCSLPWLGLAPIVACG